MVVKEHRHGPVYRWEMESQELSRKLAFPFRSAGGVGGELWTRVNIWTTLRVKGGITAHEQVKGRL